MITRMGLKLCLVLGLWFCMGSFISIGSVWGTCTPGTHWSGTGYYAEDWTSFGGGPWSGDNYIPWKALTQQLGSANGPTSGYWYLGAVQCACGSTDTGWHSGSGVKHWGRNIGQNIHGCGVGVWFSCHFVYGTYGSNGDSLDFDCDSFVNGVDQYPGDPTRAGDQDSDGYDDVVDLWPTDPNLPGNAAQWYNKNTYTRKSDGKKIEVWTLSDGSQRFMTTETGDFDISNLADWTVTLNMSPTAKTWTEATTGVTDSSLSGGVVSGGDVTTSDIVGGETVHALNEISGKLSGIKGDLDSISGYGSSTVSQLQGIGGKLDTGNSKLDAIKTSIDNKAVPSLAGTEARLDTANTTLGEIKSDLDNIKDNLPQMGTGDLPDAPGGEVGQIQDDALYNEEAVEGHKSTAKTALSNLLDSLIAGNPILSWAGASGVEYGGGSSSVSFSVCGVSCSLDASWVGSKLDEVGAGTFFLAFCGLMGVVAILRD